MMKLLVTRVSCVIFCAKASHQDTHLCGILFDEPATLSKLACEMAKTSHQDTHLCGILFDEPATLSKLACKMEKASHQDIHLCGILFDEPASSSRGIKSSLLDYEYSFLQTTGNPRLRGGIWFSVVIHFRRI